MDINWKLIIGMIVVGMIISLVGINMTIQPAYDLGACTFNSFDCGLPSWDGVCTQDVKDDCCIPVRMCTGSTSTPEDCYTKYCTANEMCVPVFNVANDNYDCECKTPY